MAYPKYGLLYNKTNSDTKFAWPTLSSLAHFSNMRSVFSQVVW